MLTNVAYRRFKQSDFHNNSFIIDILSFLVQNFNPVNLDIKHDNDKEREMVKFLWDECVPHDFVSFLYKEKQYNEVSQTNLTYQKANNIVKEYLSEDVNRINHLKFKIEDKFELIHYVHSLLFSKIYNKQITLESKEKMNSTSIFNCGKKRSYKEFNLIFWVKIQITTIGSLKKWNNNQLTFH